MLVLRRNLKKLVSLFITGIQRRESLLNYIVFFILVSVNSAALYKFSHALNLNHLYSEFKLNLAESLANKSSRLCICVGPHTAALNACILFCFVLMRNAKAEKLLLNTEPAEPVSEFII